MTASHSDLFQDMPFEDILKCVHCGLCLDACPTYRELGAEQDSPRGRLYLMRGLWEGELTPDFEVMAPLNRCLDCRACESACPSGVPYGALIEKTRTVLKPFQKEPFFIRALVSLFLRRLLPSDFALLWLSRFARLWQVSRLQRLAAFTLPRFLARTQLLMPVFSGRSFKSSSRSVAILPEPERPLVALFSGCIMDVSEQEIHEATEILLRHAGFGVITPEGQTCCGALQVHAGERAMAQKLARKNLSLFGGLPIHALVANSAGCGAQLKEYCHLFPEDSEELAAFQNRVFDLMALLASRADFVRINSWRDDLVTVIYDAPCHLIHAQKIDSGPRGLLVSLPGVTLVTPRESSRCCGAAGIYNLLFGELSEKILERKMDDLEVSLRENPNASVLLTANPGCLFQLRYGIAQRKLPIQVMHPAVFLAQRLTEPTSDLRQGEDGCVGIRNLKVAPAPGSDSHQI